VVLPLAATNRPPMPERSPWIRFSPNPQPPRLTENAPVTLLDPLRAKGPVARTSKSHHKGSPRVEVVVAREGKFHSRGNPFSVMHFLKINSAFRSPCTVTLSSTRPDAGL
jgi:hypothetical protein